MEFKKNIIIILVLFQIIILTLIGYNYIQIKTLDENYLKINSIIENGIIESRISEGANSELNIEDKSQSNSEEEYSQTIFPYFGNVIEMKDDSFKFEVNQYENDVLLSKIINVVFMDENQKLGFI